IRMLGKKGRGMTSLRNSGYRTFFGLTLVALLAIHARDARAQAGSCGAGLDPTISQQTPPFVGDTVTIKLTLSTGSLQNGTHMTVTSFLYAPDCPNDGGFSEPSKTPCANAGTTKLTLVPGTESLGTINVCPNGTANPSTVTCTQASGGAGNSQVITCSVSPA